MRFAFTGRAQGNLSLVVGEGDARAARRRALAAVGARLEHAVFMEQVHGARVAVVDARDGGRGATDPADAVSQVDAMVTTSTDVALAVLVADCVPVVIAAPGRGVGVAHAGRRGLERGVVAAAISALVDAADVDTSAIHAVVGPGIGGCCYEVPEELARAFTKERPEAGARTTWGTSSLDLRRAVAAELDRAGVGHVGLLGGCTRCEVGRWYSHRGAQAGMVDHGRQAAIVVRSSVSDQRPSGSSSLH